MVQNFNSVEEFCKNVSRGTFGVSIITMTVPKMRKTNNPFFNRVHKATYMTNVALGYDYENTVNNHLEKKGLDRNYTAVKPNGKSWSEYPYILCADKDNAVKYLRCTMRKNTKVKSVYLLDGKIVSDNSILDEIKSFIQTSSYSKKQAESGLNDAEQVIVRDYKMDGIIALTQGEKNYNRIMNLVNTETLKEYFK